MSKVGSDYIIGW